MFDGVPFGEDSPYNYLDARQSLDAAMAALRGHADLKGNLGMDPNAPGRHAIGDDPREGVWDYLQLCCAGDGSKFNEFPHLTLCIQRPHVFTLLVLPNSMKAPHRNSLQALTEQNFVDLLRDATNGMTTAMGEVAGFSPWVEVVQRHYRREPRPVLDARLDFDGRTLLEGDDSKVKYQPFWAKAAYALAVGERRANTQLAIGAIFPYDLCPMVRTPKALDLFAHTWLASKPILAALGL